MLRTMESSDTAVGLESIDLYDCEAIGSSWQLVSPTATCRRTVAPEHGPADKGLATECQP